jgi:hypothetical protein
LVFAIIEGGRNIIIILIPALLDQFGIYQELLEMVIEVMLLIPLIGVISFFIFRVGAPLAIADSVSKINSVEVVEEPKLVCQKCGTPQLTVNAEFCGNCGTLFETK